MEGAAYNRMAAEGIEPPTLRVWTVRSSQLSYTAMAPQVGLEPTTDRLTADSSTTELLWNIISVFQSNIYHCTK